MTRGAAPGGAQAPAVEVAAVDPRLLARVESVVLTLGKAVRAHQLYEGASPVYDRFVEVLRESFAELWAELGELGCEIGESSITWEGVEVYRAQHRSDNLAFLFHRDGIRELVFLPGFEDRDLPLFLSLLARVHRARDDQDDLVTLLWESDLACLRYRHVDVSVDGIEVPEASGAGPRAVDPALVRFEAESGRPAAAAARAYEAPLGFQETLYFLDEAELRQLLEELRRELNRDLWTDVLHGLFDRLEDGAPERQQRVVRILTELLPALISSAQMREAGLILRELAALAAREPALPAAVLREVRALFEQLAAPETVRELVRSVEDTPDAVRVDEFSTLLGYFPPAALAPLIGAAETAVRPEVRRLLHEVVARLAAHDPEHVVGLLGSTDPALAAGAARLVGSLARPEAAPALARLLERPEPAVRLAAVRALQELRVSSGAAALQAVLADPEREVRIAAARALGALRYSPARERLAELIGSRRVREADVTERIAFFEAFGSVADAEGVALLARLLNGRSWLGRREPPEIRACAALALGCARHPDAARALSEAADDAEPVVRTAVARALRREAS